MNQPVLTLYRYRCVSVPDVFVYRSLEGSPGGPAEVSCMALSGGEHFWTWHDMTVHPWNWPFQKERFSSNHQFLRGCGRTNCFKCTTILFPPAIMEAEHGALEDEFSLQDFHWSVIVGRRVELLQIQCPKNPWYLTQIHPNEALDMCDFWTRGILRSLVLGYFCHFQWLNLPA